MKYLVRKINAKVKHLAVGNDTSCRLKSTGGLNTHRYELTDHSNLRLCVMCKNNAKKHKLYHPEGSFEARKAKAMESYQAKIDLDRSAVAEAKKRL